MKKIVNNNYGFGIIEMLIIMFSALLILIVCTIVYNINFKYEKNPNEDVMPSITSNNENTDKIEDYEKIEEKEIDKSKYKLLEDELTNAAKIYILNNYPILDDKIIVSLNKLIENNYIDKLVDPDDKKNTCNGYVIYNDNNYSSYINCNDNYISEGYNVDFE